MNIVNLREELLTSLINTATLEAESISSGGGVTISVARGTAYDSVEDIGDRLYSSGVDIAIHFNHFPAEHIVTDGSTITLLVKFSVAVAVALEKGQPNILAMGFVEQIIAKAMSAIARCNRRVMYSTTNKSIMSKHMVVLGEIHLEVERGVV